MSRKRDGIGVGVEEERRGGEGGVKTNLEMMMGSFDEGRGGRGWGVL